MSVVEGSQGARRERSRGAAGKRDLRLVEAAAPAAALAAPAELAPGYRVVGHLHRSGLLDTYDVWSHERQCRCVAKVLRPDQLANRRARERLLREGALLEGITHPHIVRAYDTLDGPTPVVVLETLGGQTLERLIARSRRRLGEGDLVLLGLQLCSAAHYLHGQGLLHLDLKPANVVIGPDGRARVLDLSLARPPGPARRGVGTRPYQSPEQMRGGELSEAADVWGVGVVLWEAATGRRPFSPDTDDPFPQLERRAAPVRSRRRRLPTDFAAAVDACLETAPSRRPTVEEITRRLRAQSGDHDHY